MTGLRTPLSEVRGLGSAKDGTRHWWMQRVTAVALVPLVVVFAVYVISLTGADRETVRASIGAPFGAGVAILLVATAFYHLRLGLQVVIEDYVASTPVRIALQLANVFGCAVLALIAVLSVLSLSFGD